MALRAESPRKETNMNMRSPLSAGTIERVLRHNLSQPGSDVQEAAGWSAVNISTPLVC